VALLRRLPRRCKFTDATIKILIEYREGGHREQLFVDEVWGYENANKLIFRGADVVFAAGGVTGQGALRAASEAGVYAIGTERDQAAALGVAGSSVVTSFYGQTSFEVQEMMRFLQGGQLPEGRIGPIRFVPLSQNFPELLGFELEALRIMLLDSRIITNVPFRRLEIARSCTKIGVDLYLQSRKALPKGWPYYLLF
jgi:basic membrane protein A and related proteins